MQKLIKYLENKNKCEKYEKAYLNSFLEKSDLKEMKSVFLLVLFFSSIFTFFIFFNIELRDIAIANNFDFYDNGAFIIGEKNRWLINENIDYFKRTLENGFLIFSSILISPLLFFNWKKFVFFICLSPLIILFLPKYYLVMILSISNFSIILFSSILILALFVFIYSSFLFMKNKIVVNKKDLSKEKIKKLKRNINKELKDLLDDQDSMKCLLNMYQKEKEIKEFKLNNLSFYISEEIINKEFNIIIDAYRLKVQGFKSEREYFLNCLDNEIENKNKSEIELVNM